jgi:lipopolysaccharide biosynthesis regulator YciM
VTFLPIWFQENLLAIALILITVVLMYFYLIERDHGVKLSKKYRNSIFEAQSRIFLNATQYLISGNKDLAIKEFLNAVDLNRETIETYFALGGLFRSNGEIEKAISIHRSLIARNNISESTRLEALKELAVDFDKGGFLEKAIETYRDVLKINRDQSEAVKSLCRIYEDIEDWEQAYNYRVMYSKVGTDDQTETISHILVQKAKKLFNQGDFRKCAEELDDAFRFAPSVSAKILRLRLSLAQGDLDFSKSLLFDLLKEQSMYTTFIFESLNEKFNATAEIIEKYFQRLTLLKEYFLQLDDIDLLDSPSVILTKVRLLKQYNQADQAYTLLKKLVDSGNNISDALKIEFIKTLIELDKKDEITKHTKDLVNNLHETLARYFCQECGFDSDTIFWRCPQCKEWETIQFRWKV